MINTFLILRSFLYRCVNVLRVLNVCATTVLMKPNAIVQLYNSNSMGTIQLLLYLWHFFSYVYIKWDMGSTWNRELYDTLPWIAPPIPLQTSDSVISMLNLTSLGIKNFLLKLSASRDGPEKYRNKEGMKKYPAAANSC